MFKKFLGITPEAQTPQNQTNEKNDEVLLVDDERANCYTFEFENGYVFTWNHIRIEHVRAFDDKDFADVIQSTIDCMGMSYL